MQSEIDVVPAPQFQTKLTDIGDDETGLLFFIGIKRHPKWIAQATVERVKQLVAC